MYKNSVSLSILLSSLFVIAQCSHFSPYSPGNDHDMRLQTRESRRSWEKAFCSEILVPVITVRTLIKDKKLSDFFLFVSLISLLHTIFMRMITRQCNSYFCNIFLASWRESPKRLKTFDGRREIWYAFPYYLLMQKQMRVKLMIVLGLVDWRALVSSLKEELTQP